MTPTRSLYPAHAGPVMLAVALLVCPAAPAAAPPSPSAPARTSPSTRDILTDHQWRQVDDAVDRALKWIARQQRSDGSFPTLKTGQPGVTALCVLAFLSRGHLPSQGRYAATIDKGIAYTLTCQHPDGLLARYYPSMPMASKNPTHTAHYNHAIAGLMLAEAYGMTTDTTNRRIRPALESALNYARKTQLSPPRRPNERGGGRYARPRPSSDSDLSVTSWQLMFLRSGRNAGFDVPAAYIDEALTFVRRCYVPQNDTFLYGLYGNDRHTSRAITGAGILALSLGGQHQTEPARRAGQWLLRHPFNQYNTGQDKHDRYFYGVFYCSQAMYQLGGTYWARFYPAMIRPLLAHQRPDGSWDAESGKDKPFGNTYSTAMAVLAISTPDQLLPIFQR